MLLQAERRRPLSFLLASFTGHCLKMLTEVFLCSFGHIYSSAGITASKDQADHRLSIITNAALPKLFGGAFIPPLFRYLPILYPFSSSYGVTLSAVGSPHMSLILFKVSSELLSTYLRHLFVPDAQ